MDNSLIISPWEQLRVALGEQVHFNVKPAVTHNLQDTTKAVACVINYILTDAFDLAQEESFWVGYELQSILSPISALRPHMYLAAVKQELDTKEYSNKLFEHNWEVAGTGQKTFSSMQAPISDWAEMLSEIVLVSYPDLRAALQAAVIGSIYGVLVELGLTENVNTSRQSVHLPNAMRYLAGLQDD